MIWRSRYGLLFVFLLIGTSHGRKPLEKTEKETPEPDSVSDDKKVSSSISQLLRSLAAPAESERRGRSRPVEIITKHGIISARGQSARKLYFGVDPVSPGGSVASGVPPPVVVSSQAIRISGGSGANGTGGNKRARSLFTAQTSTVDKDGVKTIEGVRVPDDEHDKHHTWRNARVIKNFLVENNRPANPHRKRQIMIQDASQYLAGQGVSPTSYAYADASTLAQVASQALNLNPAQGQTLYYATQPQQQSAQTAQDLTSAIYAAAAASQQQQQQQQYQYQAAPASSTGSGSKSQQSYATQQQQQQPQQGQMYVLQPDGKTYLPYTPGMQLTSAQLAAVAQAQDPQAHPQNLGQLQFASRSLEATSSEEATNARQSQIQLHQQQVHQQQQIQQYQLQQQALKLQQQQQQQQEQQQQQQLQQQQQHKKLQQEQEYQKLILSKHQNAQHQQKKQQQSQQSQQSQQKPQVSVHAHSGQVPSVTPASHPPAGSPSTPSPLLHKVASPEQLQLQQLAHIAATAAPTGASIGQQLQEQVSAQSAYFLQQSDASRPQSLSLADTQSTQQQQQQVLSHSGGLIPLSHAQIPTVSILQDRSSPGLGQMGVGAMPVSASQFVIQPQTYMAGGGQMFSVPVPIPIDQIQHASEQHHQILHHPHYEKDQESSSTKKEAKNTLTNKLMESLNFSMNKRTAERLETSTIVPVLASAGIVLGLGALAAGWYLSQNNREVGILKKSGKFGNNMNNNNMNMNNMNGNNMGNLPAPANSANNGGKDNAVIAHVRRRRETQGGEVDQASFFQSIIQHGIEKQQQQYESAEPAQFDPQPSRKQYSGNNNNNNDLFSSSSAPLNRVREEQVQIKPLSYTRHSERISERVRERGDRDRGDRDRGDRDRVDRDRDHNRDRERDSYNGYASGSSSSSSSSNNIKSYRADDRESIADKSGKGGGGQSKVKNFAKVAIPAIILGGSVVVIGALIFGWYISGKNREIAFLEPSAYSRRKRSLSSLSLSSSALSDSWLHHTLTSIHSNPYETKGSPAFDANHPHPVDSDNTNNSRGVGWDHGGHSFGHWPTTTYKQAKHSKYSQKKHGMLHRRSLPSTNEMVVDLPDNPSFLHKILGNLEFSQNSLLNKLQETDYSKWQETPCAQRIFCDVMSTQGDDTVRLMEKRMTKFLSMLPETLSDSLAQRLGSVMSAINKKDCSAYTCGGHWVDSTVISQPSAPASQPR